TSSSGASPSGSMFKNRADSASETIRKALFSPRTGASVRSLGREPQDQPTPPNPPRFRPARRPNSGRRPELGRRAGRKRGELGVGTANLGLTPQATDYRPSGAFRTASSQSKSPS